MIQLDFFARRRIRASACGMALLVGLSLLAPPATAGPTWVRKKTGTDWTWFEDYAFKWATYRVACEPGRQCQVGMGIFTLGQPLGEKISFSGETEIFVIGFGSLHIRPSDGRGPVKAAVSLKDPSLFSVSWDF